MLGTEVIGIRVKGKKGMPGSSQTKRTSHKNTSKAAKRLKAILITLGGLVVLVLGIGMWKSPEIDWQGFVGAWGLIGDEFTRLKEDPFAVLGILIIIVGAYLTYRGIRWLLQRDKQ